MPKDFLATPVAPAAAAAVQGGAAAAAAARPAQVSAAAEAMRGALGGFRDAMGTGHAELDETFAAQQKALVALLRAYPLGGEKVALDEVSAVQLLQPPVAPVRQQQQQGGQEGMLSGLQRIEEAKLLARKAEAALVSVGGGSAAALSAAALQLQRNALESLDAAEQMAELEMQKEALELEEKESRLLKGAP